VRREKMKNQMKRSRSALASLLSVVIFGQSIIACHPGSKPQYSRVQTRSVETELTSGSFESDNEPSSSGKSHWANEQESQHEWFDGSNADDVSEEEMERARAEISRQIAEDSKKTIKEIEGTLKDTGIDIPVDGTGGGTGTGGGSGTTGGATPGDGEGGSGSAGGSGGTAGPGTPGGGGTTPPNEEDLKKDLQKKIDAIEDATKRINAQRDNTKKNSNGTKGEIEREKEKSKGLKQQADNAQGRIDSKGRKGQGPFDSNGKAQNTRHNQGVKAAIGALPEGLKKANVTREGDGSRPEDDLPASPVKDAIKHERNKITFLENTSTTPESKKALGRSHGLLDSAAKYAGQGDIERAKLRQKQAGDLAHKAAGMAGRNLDGVPDEDGLDRGAVEDISLELFDAGVALDEEGMGSVADKVIEHAGDLMEAAYEAARMVGVVDTAANAMEAFTGQTIDFDDEGKPYLREASTVERAIAAVDLALTVAGAAVAGPVGAVAAGVVGDIGKSIVRKEGKQAAREAAEKAAKEGLGMAEKAAAEKAAKEAAEREAEVAAKEADRLADSIKPNERPVLPKRDEPLVFGNEKKIRSQMKQRDWTEEDIRDAFETEGIPAVGQNGAATRYVNPKNGKSVVVENATGEIFHIGKPGYFY
jgi:hypothetical protein